MRRRDCFKLLAAAAPVGLWNCHRKQALSTHAESALPKHPSELKYSKLTFDPPQAAKYRHELPHGAVAYLVEDHQLPLVSLSATIRMGSYLVPAEHAGLASMTGSQMRTGGTKTMPAREFDEEAAFLASQISSSIGSTSAGAGLDCLKQNFDASLKMFFDVLKNPGFDAERLELARGRRLQGMQRRNDRTGSIERREYARLLRGDKHFTTQQTTKATLESITRERMIELHQRYYHPSAFIFSASGDFETKDMLARLASALGDGWPGKKQEIPAVPAPNHKPTPGVYMVNKSGVNQSRVSIAHIGIQRDNPDHLAVGIMNSILGGGGFTSRIMTRVRSDEGLAYSAGSSFRPGTYYPGTFRASFQSRNPTCAQAAAIVLEEIAKMQSEKVTTEELDTAKNYTIEIFPRFFATASIVAGTFASDEYTKREKDYWEKYRDRIASVTQDDVLRVAQKYIHPEQFVILAVGNVEEMTAGNPDKPEYKFEKLAKDGEIHEIPLPDPLTMVYPEA